MGEQCLPCLAAGCGELFAQTLTEGRIEGCAKQREVLEAGPVLHVTHAGSFEQQHETGTYTLSASGSLVLTSSTGTTSTGQISADGSSLVVAHVTATQEPQITLALRQ